MPVTRGLKTFATDKDRQFLPHALLKALTLVSLVLLKYLSMQPVYS